MLKGNLLIVDDEVLLLERLRFLLGNLSDKVLIADDGFKALEIMNTESIHCVLCDINMPKMNGIEVIRKIREMNYSVPFVFYTGHGNHELMLEAVKYGAFDFLSKPSFDGLEEVIERGLKRGCGNEENLEQSDFMSEYQKLLEELNSK